jgi:hypothetical protein
LRYPNHPVEADLLIPASVNTGNLAHGRLSAFRATAADSEVRSIEEYYGFFLTTTLFYDRTFQSEDNISA